MEINNCQWLKILSNKRHLVQYYLIAEDLSQINVNKILYEVAIRIPREDIDFIRGLLYTEEALTKKQ